MCEWSSFVGIPDPGCPPDFLTSTVTATYSSEGMLYTLERDAVPTARHVFYFGGRPVALRDLTGTTETWRWVTTDHLGTPIAATSTTGALLWSGGFEPFGRDFTIPSAQESGVFLRFPGQWFDEAWEESSLGAEVYYNVHRWYDRGTGRYTRTDPVAWVHPTEAIYLYADSAPLRLSDPLGLWVVECEDCESLRREIRNVLRRLHLLRTTGTAADPSPGASNQPVAATYCIGMRDAETGRSLGTQSFTDRVIPAWQPGPCAGLCTGAHERVHRRMCTSLTAPVYSALSEADVEIPAYTEQYKCLLRANSTGQLDLSPSGVTY